MVTLPWVSTVEVSHLTIKDALQFGFIRFSFSQYFYLYTSKLSEPQTHYISVDTFTTCAWNLTKYSHASHCFQSPSPLLPESAIPWIFFLGILINQSVITHTLSFVSSTLSKHLPESPSYSTNTQLSSSANSLLTTSHKGYKTAHWICWKSYFSLVS